MRKSNQILQNFFGTINDNYILNVLYVLKLILNIPDHQKRLQEIMDIANLDCSLDTFSEVLIQEVSYYENLLDGNKNYLMEERVIDKTINVIQDTPIIWCFIALYWVYDLKNKDEALIAEIYNPRIGDIALKFLLYFLKMKEKEAHCACTEHDTPFYGDIAARLVRIIDILPIMYAQHSEHLTKLYFPTLEIDLALNFLETQVNNSWEQTTLSIEKVKETSKSKIISKIIYNHSEENLNFSITPSRMTKKGAFNNLDKTFNNIMKLYNLDLAGSSTNYNLVNKRKSLEKIVLPSTITPHEEELIYEDSSIDPEILSSEDKIEQKANRKAYRRDMKDFSDTDEDSEEEVKEYVIPNSFQQHKRNIAFSSKLSKERLLLKSDYDIPIPEHLKAFISTLNTEDNDTKIYTGYFILNVSLGCKPQDLLRLLQERKEGLFQLKNGVITVDIDSSLFASNYSELLSQSENKLIFNIPIMMTMLIVMMKRTFLAKDFNQVDFLEGYKKFLNNSVKQFSKKITIKWEQVNRYLAQYLQDNGKDVLTSKLATAAFSQNDTAKLAYLSSQTNATEHSPLIKNYWDKLDLDEISSNIVDINIITSTHTSSGASKTYSGSSQAVETSKANDFFKALRQNIYNHHSDKDLYFNLVAIYTRFSMSLLAGTRSFIESANFTSYDKEIGIWGISEKAQDIASGARLVPVCNRMKSILNNYQELLKKRGLKNNFYLIVNGETVTFSKYLAYKFLQNTHNLDDIEILEECIENVPLNTGRHLFVRKAIDVSLLNMYHISTYLGHYAAGEEQFGIYSTLDFQNYSDVIKMLTTKIAQECGIKEL